jgi:hypothetical protein
MSRPRPTPVAAALLAAVVLGSALVAAGCDALRGSAPAPTPGDFGALSLALAKRDVHAETVVSGDAGCDDATLAPTAISFRASGLDQAAPVTLRVYLFRDDATFQRRRADVDTCAAAWASDPSSFEFVDASPWVLAGQGPWGAEFKAAVRAALAEAAGSGG